MRKITTLAILSLIILGQVFAQTKKSDLKQIFPLGEKNDANAQYFIGQSYLAVLTTDNVTSYNVTFEPGCRNNWHIHHKGGQILYCTAGNGWYQEEGKPARALRPGDVVNIPAGVKHWHGAAKDSWFAHIALMVPAEGATHEWLSPVTDEEYNKLK
ncbi:4-carboxymuconolactone decarboxylase [Aquipluma nitroreducens]|uniref:4-carboxymuconolactone decarboxylase n=1 Tax=Aquipluma nitroreducens TaxID=2010828 RepID=A0A5K7S7B9_9BACT|nr:cupin domain-containing protein [Aquipluma nitroreducens]BBE17453.1 4-carboxymuconolactone decarboxylase [Aquipluma nitroreducens]